MRVYGGCIPREASASRPCGGNKALPSEPKTSLKHGNERDDQNPHVLGVPHFATYPKWAPPIEAFLLPHAFASDGPWVKRSWAGGYLPALVRKAKGASFFSAPLKNANIVPVDRFPLKATRENNTLSKWKRSFLGVRKQGLSFPLK